MRKFLFQALIRMAKWFAPRHSQDINIDEAFSPKTANPVPARELPSTITCNVSIRKAMNGRVLELASWVPSTATGRHIGGNAGEWKHSLYVIKDGERIDEAVTTLLVTQALDR